MKLWKAFDTQQKRYVHFKLLHIPQAALSDFAPRFLQETQKLLTLHHPHIAPIIDTQLITNAQGNKACVITEYRESQLFPDFLEATIHAGTFLDANEMIKLLMALASAIDYAHQQGIIHGAVQPANILLDKGDTSHSAIGDAKLLGFGMQHLIPAHALPLEATYYISPERAQGLHENLRSDIYALGILLYELSTGALPFQGETSAEVLEQQIHAMPTSPSLINPRIRPALTAVIMRSLAKEPANRFPNAMALVGAAARALQVSKDFPNLVSITPSFAPTSLSGPMPALDPRNTPQYPSSTPYIQQPSGSHLAIPATGSGYSPAQTQAARNTGGMAPIQASRSGDSGASTRQNSQPYAFSETVRQTPPGVAPLPKKIQRRPGRLYLALIALLIVVLLASALGILFLNPTKPGTSSSLPASNSLFGHAFLVSSGQLDPNTIQGTADRLQISLQSLPQPAAGQSYYMWLLSPDNSSSQVQALLLATSSHGGQITTTFQGDNQHNNLLASYSRILVTEESADTPPANPSLDPQTHRFAAEISTIPSPTDPEKYSLLDHMRHLLSQDPKLKLAGLSGGLDLWLFNNTLKILETAGSIRDSQNTDFIRRQLVRILDYLDSSSYIQTENLPAGLPPVEIDPNIAKVAMLNFDVQQNPPGYLKHIGNHLRAITVAPGVTPEQKALAIQINLAINNVQAWMQQVHLDAQKLIHLPANQLTQPAGAQLLDDLFTKANTALVGQTDPNTNQIKEGVIQIHYNMQRLATFDLTSCHGSNGSGCE